MPINEFDLSRYVGNVVLPPLPPFPRGSKDSIERIGPSYPSMGISAADRVETTQFGTPQVIWLKWKIASQSEDKWWLLPIEPIISVNGRNVLIKRNVAKGRLRGTIKERWMQDDYSINIQGLFTKKDTYEYPTDDLQKLKMICEAREPIDVLCPILELYGINRIVIENFDIPFTKGEENQNWQVNAVSDDDWDLLIDINDKGKDAL